MTTIDRTIFSEQTRQGMLLGSQPGAAYTPVKPAGAILGIHANDTIFPAKQGLLPLGAAENGLPLWLDLYDPTHGPLLVAGDGGSGKTTFLQSLTLGSDLQDPGDILFGVVTPFPEEWAGLEILSNCLGIWPAYHPAARHFMTQLISWADVLPETRQVVILLIDGLDLLISNGFNSQNDLRWLLTYGPRRHIWPFISANPGRLQHADSWMEYFQTRILGQVKRSQTAHLLGIDPEINLATLSQGGQFVLWRKDGWQKIRLSPENAINLLSAEIPTHKSRQ